MGEGASFAPPGAPALGLVDHLDTFYGAQPLNRILKTDVLNPLAMELLEGTLSESDHVLVDVAENGEGLAFQRVEAREPRVAEV